MVIAIYLKNKKIKINKRSFKMMWDYSHIQINSPLNHMYIYDSSVDNTPQHVMLYIKSVNIFAINIAYVRELSGVINSLYL